MKAARIVALALFAWIFIPGEAFSQPASYFEGGIMNMRLRNAGRYSTTNLPGFSVAVSGLEFSFYSGKVANRYYPDSTQIATNGGFWHIGYIYRSLPKENLKRFHWTLGFGMGSYGLNEMNGVQASLHPGIQVNLTRSISLAASCYAGYNFFSSTDKDTTLSWSNSGYLSTEKWFFLPSVTLRFNTNPMAVKGKSYDRKSYWGGGMVTNETTSREGDYIVTRKSSYYLPAGEYVTDAIVTSTNYINMFPKMTVGHRKNDRGPSLAFGGGIAFRLGLLALDLEHIRGKIGFHDSYSDTGDKDWQWKMKRSSVGLGLNFFNIPFPARGPSIVRFIFGARIGSLTLESNRTPNPYPAPGTSASPENHKGFFWSSFLAIEFGTLGVHMDFYSNKDRTFASGFVLSGTYLIPLSRRR